MKPRLASTLPTAFAALLVGARCSVLTSTDELSGRAKASSDGEPPDSSSVAAPDGSDVGATSGEVFLGGQNGVSSLSASATTLYWTTAVADGSVASCPLAGCATPSFVAP